MVEASPPGFPTRQQAVLPELLQNWASSTPSAPFALFDDGSEWSFRETAERAFGLAQAFVDRLGLRQGEVVASWLPNGPEALTAWFATNSAGGIYAPLNTAYRGSGLAHSLTVTDARILVAHAELVDRLRGLELPDLQVVVVVGGPAPDGLDYDVLDWAELADARADQPPRLARPVEPWDDMTVLLTAGTTGLSKAVRRTYAQYHRYTWTCFELPGVQREDRFYVCAPMFHGGADVPIFSMLQLGASIAVDEVFSASRFWSRVRHYGCTVAWIHSAMSLFLHKQPERPDDADNPLRLGMLAPLFPGFEGFARRHGFVPYMVYGMTEMSCIFSVLNPVDHGSLGQPADPGYEIRLVDQHDREVPVGQPGEMIVRHTLPWVVTPGYRVDAEATARAWRNGWFHTGDVFARDAQGRFRLVDRVKDSLRRRGENISAAEVETELLQHPDVLEAAVIGVAAEVEEEVLAHVVLRPHSQVAAAHLHAYLADRLPYFAVPRYLAITDALPRNVALRVDKPALRRAGVPDDVWDASQTTARVHRERFRAHTPSEMN